MIHGDRGAVPCVSHQRVVIGHGVQRGVGGVAVVALVKHMAGLGLRLHEVNQRKHRHPFPIHIELAPGGDAVKIAGVLEGLKRHELLPIERHRILHQPVNLQGPLLARHFGVDAHVEHGKIIDLTLAGREAFA